MAYSNDKISKLGHLKELARRSLIKISEVVTTITESLEEMAESISDLFTASTDQATATRISLWSDYQEHTRMEAEITGETYTVTLTNTQKQPFNSTLDSPSTIALTKARKTLYYSVEPEVTAHKGLVGDIQISDKALNGFKVAYTGSGTSVTLTLRVKGGMA